VLEEKLAQVLLCQPQIPRGLSWYPTRGFVIRRQQYSPWIQDGLLRVRIYLRHVEIIMNGGERMGCGDADVLHNAINTDYLDSLL
jgi:hypothetical protein